jgi:energy-coupling factor transporter ATP-binding protein EcfA2
MSATPLLHAAGIEKRFGALVAASAIDIAVAPGERVSLIGSNGAGKTTFVNMITGYLKPDAGSITLAGRDITRYTRARSPASASPARSRSRSSTPPSRCSKTCWSRPPAAARSSRSGSRRDAPRRCATPTRCSPASPSPSSASGASPSCPAA